MKLIAKFALNTAKMNANSACPWFLYVQKLPEGVKKMRKC